MATLFGVDYFVGTIEKKQKIKKYKKKTKNTLPSYTRHVRQNSGPPSPVEGITDGNFLKVYDKQCSSWAGVIRSALSANDLGDMSIRSGNDERVLSRRKRIEINGSTCFVIWSIEWHVPLTFVQFERKFSDLSLVMVITALTKSIYQHFVRRKARNDGIFNRK